jgi:hypothetical protein
MTTHVLEKTYTAGLGRGWCVLGLVAFLLSAHTGVAFAQSIGSSTLHGKVTDDTGGALPGVTVTLASPALQVKQVVLVTGADGTYRFVDLPAGTYEAKFELSAFKTVIRQDLHLTIGFVATVDVAMQVGAIEESVTVSGQSPVVDLTSTSASVGFTKETLETVPRGRDLQNVFAMAPGVTQGTPDVGGSTMATNSAISSYGVAAIPKIQVEGINVTIGNEQVADQYFMSDTLEDVQIKTSGTDAEVSTPGISFVGVLKSGGNQFHGTYVGSFQSPTLQSNNLDASLQAQGLNDTAPLKSFFDVSGDLGGRIVRDKLWFYIAASRQKKTQSLLGFVSGPGPDGRYLTGDEPLADYQTQLDQKTAKLSYQLSKRNRLVYAFQNDPKRQPQNGAGRFVPLEATRDYVAPHAMQKGEIQSSLSDRTLVNIVAGYTGYETDYDASRSYGRVDAPPRLDLETGVATGSHPLHQAKHRNRYTADGGISFFPEGTFLGKHELKTGGNLYVDVASDGYANNLAGNYILQTDKINGVSGTPSRIVFRNTPAFPFDTERTYAWYIKDTWRLTDRLTANLGLRWEHQHSFLPAQSRDAARDVPTVFPAGTFPYRDIGSWTRTVPRIGIAWKLGEKSVVKASVGEYNYIFGDTFGDIYNANATGTATFRWHDLNGNTLYEPGEVDLSTSSLDFISITGASSARINPDMKQPKTWEATASVERELAQNLGFRAMYVDRTLIGYFSGAGPNILRPYNVYDIPITRRDPGPNGILGTADDAGNVTFYDYSPAYRGAAFVSTQLANSPQDDHYRTVEFAITRRPAGRWSGQVSYFVTKNHTLIQKTINSPNDEFFPWDDTYIWAGTVTGTYRLPYGVSVSGFLTSQSGLRGRRTNLFRQIDPDGGTPIAQLSTVTLPLEPFGSQSLAAINVLNLRANKGFSIGGSRRLAFDFDVFNVLNSNAPLSATFASGPTFGYVTDVLPGRIARIGARFTF